VENSLRLLVGRPPLPLVAAAPASLSSSDPRVRRYQAAWQLDTGTTLMDVTELVLGLEREGEDEEEMVFTKRQSFKRSRGSSNGAIKNDVGETTVWSGLAIKSSNSTSTSGNDHAGRNGTTAVAFLTLSHTTPSSSFLPVVVVDGSAGGLYGSLRAGRKSYSIMTHADGAIVVTVTDRADFTYAPDEPNDEAIPWAQAAARPAGLPAQIEVAKSYDITSTRPSTASFRDDEGEGEEEVEISFGPASQMLALSSDDGDNDGQRRGRRRGRRNLQGDGIAVADVLVLVTNEAMCRAST
jgi:hypothetical protein